MDVRLRYFEGCPGWRIAYARLTAALREVGCAHVEPRLELVQTDEEAERLGLPGSPTFLIDGRDPFEPLEPATGLVCRFYWTPDGLQRSPTIDQLAAALSSHAAGEVS